MMETETEVENGFQETAIGLIPHDWDVVRLGSVAEVRAGKTPSKDMYHPNGKFKILKVRDITQTGVVTWNNRENGFIDEDFGDDFLIRAGDLLLLSAAHSSKIVGTKLGFVSHVPPSYGSVFYAAELIRIRVMPQKAEAFYIYSSMMLVSTKAQIRQSVKGGHLYSGDVRQTLIPLPPLAEQWKISSILLRIQQTIEQQNRITDAARDLKKSLMQKLFGGDIKQAESKDSEIGQVPQNWMVMKLGKISSISTGTTPATKTEEYYRGEVPFIRTADINNNVINSPTTFVSSEAVEAYNLKIYPPGTVFLAMYGQGKTRGQVALLDVPATTSQNTAAIVPNNEILDSAYLWYYLQYRYYNLRSTGMIGHISHLNLSFVKDFNIPVPPVSVQRDTAHILRTVDRKIEAEKGKKVVLQQLFSTMLQKLMTGQIRVKDLDLGVSDAC